MANGQLLLHCGGALASMAEVASVETPDPTDTHFPVPHDVVYEMITSELREQGWEITEESHGLAAKGMRWFALMKIRRPSESGNGTYELVVGPRNSHDCSFSSAMGIGKHLFICDNLCFSADIILQRKHTRNILRDLHPMIATAVGAVPEVKKTTEQRIGAYRTTDIPDRSTADHLIMSLLRRKAITTQMVLPVWDAFDKPPHEEFLAPDGGRTLWTLENAVTEVWKHRPSLAQLPRRSRQMQTLFDAHACFDQAGALREIEQETEVEVIESVR